MQEKTHQNLAKIVIIFLGFLIPGFIFLGVLQGPIYSASSDTINLQGKIVRNDVGHEGLNISTGSPACVVSGDGNDTCDFRVRYYDAPTAGNLLLTEQFSNVEIGQYVGVFNVSLGSDPAPLAGVYTSLSSLIQGESDVYVEVGFDPSGLSTYTEVFSRMPLEASGYAIRAKYADSATGATELAWSGLKNPTGDLSLQHSTYTTLFNWATGTGTDNLFSLTSDVSANGTGALMNVQTGIGSTLTPFRVRAGGTEAIYVNSSGNVGIGTTSPLIKLAIGDTDTGLHLVSDGNLATYTNNVERMRINSSGNVGIGTTFSTGAPADKLTVAGGNTTIYNSASLGSEKVTNGTFADSSAWTWGTGWAHDATNLEADHTAGNIIALEQNISAIAGEIYQVVFTVKNRTVGSVTPQVGGINGAAVSSNITSTQQIRATGTGNLKFTPTSDFDGSIDTVSVKLITGGDIKLAGLLTGGGTSGIKVLANGNVGVGTTSIDAKLEIKAASESAFINLVPISPTGTSTNGEIRFWGDAYKSLTRYSAFRGVNTGGTDQNELAFLISHGTVMEAMRISDSGNVGIGTTEPGSKLDVAGTAQLRGVAGGTGLYVNSGGNVGIGTTFSTGAPADKLTVAGGNTTIYNSASLGSEKVTNGTFADSSAWTWGTGWAHDATNLEADHTAGNIIALEQNISAIAGEIYQVVFTVKNRTVGSVTPQVGGVNGVAVSSNITSTQQIRATGTGNLKFTPTSDFDGSIDTVSVKLITGGDIKLAGLLTGGGTSGIKVSANGNVGIGTTSPTSLLSVGSSSQFQVNTSGDIVKLKNLTYSWPSSHTTNGFLKDDGSGNLTWTSIAGAGGVTGTGVGGQATFWTGTSTVSGDDAFWWDNTNKRLGIGTTAPSTQLHTTGGVRFAGITTGTETTAVMSDVNGNLSKRILGSLAFENSVSLAFLDLTDVTETTYVGSGGQLVAVNTTETGLEFVSSVPASSVSFSGITSGTNTTAAMVVGDGSSLNYTGTGTINASSLLSGTWASPGAIGSTLANTGAFTTLTSTGVTTLGNNTATVAINSNDWDISTTGVMSGIGAISMDGTITGATGFNGLVITPNTGEVTTGTWKGTAISTGFGGTGANNLTAAQYSIPYYSTTGVLGGILTPGTAGYVLTTNSTGGAPTWTNAGSVGTNYWQLNSNVLAPINVSNDLAIGGNTSASAKFQIMGATGNISTVNNTVDWTLNNAIDALNIDSNTISVDALNNKVGIGTTSLTYKLEVNGDTNLSTGSVFRIGGTSVLSSTTLGSTVTGSSLTSVGTLTSGTWNATSIGPTFGGTGQTIYTTGDVLYASATNTLAKRAIGTTGQVLTVSGGVPVWSDPGAAGSVPFSGITSGTNTTAAMVVGDGSSLNYSGTGTINASSLLGGTWASPGAIGSTTANTGEFTTLSASTSLTTPLIQGRASDPYELTLKSTTNAYNAIRVVNATGVEVMSFDTMNSRVGIGTTVPSTQLHTTGGVRFAGITASTLSTAVMSDTDGNLSTRVLGLLAFEDSVPGDNWGTQVVQTNTTLTGDGTGTTPLGINLANANTWTASQTFSANTYFPGSGIWNSTGNVGIGTQTPGSSKLYVSGSSTSLVNLGDTLYVDSANKRVSIGGGTPAVRFHIQETVGGINQAYITNVGTTNAENQLWFKTGYGGASEKWSGIGQVHNDGSLRFTAGGSLSTPQITLLPSGNFGIGVVNPSSKLTLYGSSTATTIGGFEVGMRIANTDTTTNNWQSIVFGDTAKAGIEVKNVDHTNDYGDIAFTTRASDGWLPRMYIQSGGYVGVGNSSPVSLFSVGSSSQFQVDTLGDITKIKNLSYTWPTAHTTNGYLKNNGTGGLSWAEVNAIQSTGTPYGSATEGPLAFWTGTSTIGAPTPYGLYWDDVNQYLGIGTNNPSAPLDIAGGTGGSLIKNSSGDITIEPAANLIISQGDVGIGVTVPLAKLHVKGNQILLKNEADADLGLVLDSGSTTTYRDVIYFKDRGTDIFGLEKTATNAFQLYDYAGTGVSRILVEAGTNSGISFRTKGTGDFSFINDTTTRVIIDETGRVGIGMTEPARKLDILDAENSQLRLTQTNGSVYGEFKIDSAGDLTITTSGDEIFIPDTNVNIGRDGGGDSNIHFYDDNSNTWRTLKWSDVNNALYIENDDSASYKIWNEGNDGSSSGLDADKVDGLHASAFFAKPTEVKETTATHNGNFGGYDDVQSWIQTNGCSGGHVCSPWELTYAYSYLSSSYLCGDGTCSGWYNSGMRALSNYLPSTDTRKYIDDCVGWTSSSDQVFGSYWVGNLPNEKRCDYAVSVLCCF